MNQNVKKYCCKGLSILLQWVCTIQTESAGSDSQGVEAKIQSTPKRIHPLKSLSRSTPWPKNIPGNIFWWAHPGFPEGLAFSVLAHSGCWQTVPPPLLGPLAHLTPSLHAQPKCWSPFLRSTAWWTRSTPKENQAGQQSWVFGRWEDYPDP